MKNIPLYTLLWFFISFPALVLADDPNSQLAAIKSRGVLLVGVKVDWPPWGYYDDNGEIIGFEPELAQDLANRLKVKLLLQPVSASNRINKLEQGSVDVLIATMRNTGALSKSTNIIYPSYYSSGVNVLVNKHAKINSWSDLFGQPVCVIKGNTFSSNLISQFSLKPKVFANSRDLQIALKLNRCIGWLFDYATGADLLKYKSWKNFEMPLNAIDSKSWVIAVRASETDQTFRKMLSEIVIDWHRTGKLLALEKKWTKQNSQYLIDQNIRWK